VTKALSAKKTAGRRVHRRQRCSSINGSARAFGAVWFGWARWLAYRAWPPSNQLGETAVDSPSRAPLLSFFSVNAALVLRRVGAVHARVFVIGTTRASAGSSLSPWLNKIAASVPATALTRVLLLVVFVPVGGMGLAARRLR